MAARIVLQNTPFAARTPDALPTTERTPAARFFGGLAFIVVGALIAAAAKIAVAFLTFGTNDVIAFYQFAKALDAHGLPWLYENSVMFNHPPLVGYGCCSCSCSWRR